MSPPSEEGGFRGLYIGTWLSMGLYGVNAVQGWIYYNNNNDRWTLRTVVSLVLALNTAVTYIESQVLYDSLFSMQNETSTQAPASLSLPSGIFTVTILLIVDLFFAARVHYLGRCHWTVVAFIVILALVAAATGLAGIIRLTTADDSRDVLNSKETIVVQILVNVSSALCEFAAAVAICWSLHTIRTGVRRTDNVLKRIFVYTVTRGFLLTVHQILALVLLTITPTSGTIWLPFQMTLSKIYFATMLSMLNTRPNIRNRLGFTVVNSMRVDSNITFNDPTQAARTSLPPVEYTFTDPRGTDNLTTPGTMRTSSKSSTSSSGNKSENNNPEYDLGEYLSRSLHGEMMSGPREIV